LNLYFRSYHILSDHFSKRI